MLLEFNGASDGVVRNLDDVLKTGEVLEDDGLSRVVRLQRRSEIVKSVNSLSFSVLGRGVGREEQTAGRSVIEDFSELVDVVGAVAEVGYDANSCFHRPEIGSRYFSTVSLVKPDY